MVILYVPCTGGSGATGAQFLVDYDVVVVSLNYRLGALGFLSLDTPAISGNQGRTFMSCSHCQEMCQQTS